MAGGGRGVRRRRGAGRASLTPGGPAQVVQKVADLQEAISEGATSFLITEYKYMGVFMVRGGAITEEAPSYEPISGLRPLHCSCCLACSVV